MTGHTALPWHIVSARYIGAHEVADIANASIAELVASSIRMADAELIVRACDSHDQLVTLLCDVESCRDALEFRPDLVKRLRELRTSLPTATIDQVKKDRDALIRLVDHMKSSQDRIVSALKHANTLLRPLVSDGNQPRIKDVRKFLAASDAALSAAGA